MERVVKVGTRKSALALKQTELVIQALKKKNPSIDFEVIELSTTGDFRRDKLNLQVQDKKQWIIELEKGLINRSIDFAVHSGKDVPLNLEPSTNIMSALVREDARDVLIYRELNSDNSHVAYLSELPEGAIVGTSSKRRACQLKQLRPDLVIKPCRGNVPTRIEKTLEHKEFDGIVLGQAALNRLEINNINFKTLSSEELVPAVCQGTLVVQFREEDLDIRSILSSIQDSNTELCFQVEREVIQRLGADCHSSLGVYSWINNENLYLLCRVCSLDSPESIQVQKDCSLSNYIELAHLISDELIKLGANSLL